MTKRTDYLQPSNEQIDFKQIKEKARKIVAIGPKHTMYNVAKGILKNEVQDDKG
tara:strand:- start:1219 stop:1380 length:162 start_codon:yes stop_codon:yes gene_type:complete